MDTVETDHMDVRYTARLARIGLTEEEVARLQGDLDKVLAFVHQLDELDLEGVEAMSHPNPRENVLREDEVRPSLDGEEVQENAPGTVQGMIRVPRMIE